MKEEEVLQLRVPLEGEFLQRFLLLKKKYGVKSNTEVIRALIKEKYDEIVGTRVLR